MWPFSRSGGDAELSYLTKDTVRRLNQLLVRLEAHSQAPTAPQGSSMLDLAAKFLSGLTPSAAPRQLPGDEPRSLDPGPGPQRRE